jgi:putative ABC transport system permease protein
VTILRLQQILGISARNSFRFRLQGALITLAAMTGSAGVFVSSGYAAAGREKILNQFASMGTNVIVVTPGQSRAVGGRARTGALVTTLKESDYKTIVEVVDAVSLSSPTVTRVLRIRAGDLTKSTTVVGCSPDYFLIEHWPLARGGGFDIEAARRQSRVALLGASAARDLFGDDDPAGTRITINRIPFTVIGVLAERGQGLDAANLDDQIYVPLQTAMHRLMNVDFYSSLLFEIENASRLQAAADRIAGVLEERHRSALAREKDFLVQNRKSLIDTQLAALGRLTFFVRWIALSALIVSALGVFSISWIGIRNRTREIGTRRAIGATRGDILTQFFAEGILGTILGCGTGTFIAFGALSVVDSLVRQPFLFSFETSFLESIAFVSLYSFFTLASCTRAIRIQPLLALRSE